MKVEAPSDTTDWIIINHKTSEQKIYITSSTFLDALACVTHSITIIQHLVKRQSDFLPSVFGLSEHIDQSRTPQKTTCNIFFCCIMSK